MHDPDAIQFVVELEGPVALRARRDERLHTEHLDDLRVVVSHPLEDVDLALQQLAAAAALHEGAVQDTRLDPDGPQQLDRGVEDNPVVRVAVVHVGELHLDVVVVDAPGAVRELGLVLDSELRDRRLLGLAVEDAEHDRVRDRPAGAVLGLHHSFPPPSAAMRAWTFARSSRMKSLYWMSNGHTALHASHARHVHSRTPSSCILNVYKTRI